MLDFDIKREMVPCIYELLYIKGDPPVLQMKIHNDFLEANKGLSPVQEVLEDMRKEHNLGEFMPFGNEYFGFEKSLKKGKTEGDFTEFNIEIPILRKPTSEICKHCNGTGENKDLEMVCSWCEGGTFGIFYDWRSLSAVSASLHILTSMTEIFEKKTSAKSCQLLSLQVYCGKGTGGFPMSGSYGIDFCNWLASFPGHYRFNQATDAMREVYGYIFNSKMEYWDFHAYVDENAWIIIDCPGDACGLHPSDGYWKPGRGREFSCHNLDSPMQQLTLLTGLAVLSGEARKKI
jgi:hypothetical protein